MHEPFSAESDKYRHIVHTQKLFAIGLENVVKGYDRRYGKALVCTTHSSTATPAALSSTSTAALSSTNFLRSSSNATAALSSTSTPAFEEEFGCIFDAMCIYIGKDLADDAMQFLELTKKKT